MRREAEAVRLEPAAAASAVSSLASAAVKRQEKLHHYLASFRLIRVAAKHGDSRKTVASEASARPWVSKKNNRRERKAKR